MIENGIDVLLEIIGRLSAQDGLPIQISEYELNQWPKDFVKALKTNKLLTKSQPASSVVCIGCERECLMPVYHLTYPDKEPINFVVCDKRSDINRVPISSSLLEQWQVSGDLIANLIANLLGINRTNYISTDKARWEVGLLKGTKHSSHLILTNDGNLNLSFAGHSLPLSQVLSIDKCKFSIDGKLLKRLVDEPITGAGGKESAKQRRERIIKRVEELKLKDVRSFLKTVAEEEGISESRLKQITAKKNPVKPKKW